MFTRGIFLSHSYSFKLQETSSSHISHLEIVTLTLFYNASMINQLYSYMTRQLSEISQTTYNGYEVAFAILNKIDRENPDICIKMKLLKVALMNNIGVLFCNDMCRFQDAAECFEACREDVGALVGVLLLEEEITSNEAQLLSTN
eukprot:CAMPEP_0178920648 /NCGR_PEP_ID=MMETSP0786-20121207/15118_1 /TAXON_ID=186022 /ORGANISM="Thalassionema frauenfeldii, Strain CCMP 1798" /LENGTH=144 /DNA_ID=CAMNT_0020594731 /DNA_START=253 /DNA_END=684 /DNA_ORIENTATION=+